jgi:4'-phosphopantetheinyl transferase
MSRADHARHAGATQRCDGDARWPPGPRQPRLSEGELHVWLADLEEVPAAVNGSLSADERARAGGILSPAKGELWARSRGVLRELLGRYTAVDPGSLRFERGARGKPHLAAPARAIVFNASHSHTIALYAFAIAGDVGIDVQVDPRRGDPEAVARRAFGAPAARQLRATSRHAGRRSLARTWAMHEALRKCSGEGIWGTGKAQLGQAAAAPAGPWARQLEPGGAAGAVCWSATPSALRRFTWAP